MFRIPKVVKGLMTDAIKIQMPLHISVGKNSVTLDVEGRCLTIKVRKLDAQRAAEESSDNNK